MQGGGEQLLVVVHQDVICLYHGIYNIRDTAAEIVLENWNHRQMKLWNVKRPQYSKLAGFEDLGNHSVLGEHEGSYNDGCKASEGDLEIYC